MHARFLAGKEEERYGPSRKIVGLTEPMLPRSTVSTAKLYVGQTLRLSNGLPLTGDNRTRKSNALGTPAERLSSGAAAD